MPAHAPADAILVPDAQLLFHGDFKRSGVDLILSNDDREFVLHDYFKGEKRAALASPDGAHLTGDLVNALTGEVQVSQAGGAVVDHQVIGHVTKLQGSATAVRNGVSIILNMGDNVEKGDVVQSGADSTLGVTFIDGTVFGLSSNARMVLNEMVYDPNGSNNSSLLSLVAGTITFVAGETAKHGDMKIDTPVATMGIRGTAVLVEIDFTVPGQGATPDAKFQVLVEPDGTTGSYILFDKVTLQPIAMVNIAGQQINISNGVISQSSTPLSPDIQKLITDVFSLKFSDANTNTKTTTAQTDTINPDLFGPGFKLASGATATPVFLVVNPSGGNGPASSTPNGGTNLQHIPGQPLVASLDPFGKPTTGFGLTELAGKTGDAADHDIVVGRVNFADINAGDTPTVKIDFSSFSYQNAQHQDLTSKLNALQLADIAKTAIKLGLVPDPGNNNSGNATWTYSIKDSAFDFLAAGETLTLTYNIRVDNNYAPNDEFTIVPITITITGTNDAPAITTSAQTINFSGGTSVPGGDLTTSDPTSGTMTFTDVDLTDTHTVSTALTSAVLSGGSIPPGPLKLFEDAFSASISADSTGTGTGTLNWKLGDLPVYLADFIPKGQTLALTYTITVTDSQGATSTQTVTVDITGTDKPAVVWIHTTGDGSADGLWSTAQNWETGTVPTATDDVIIITDQLIGLTPVYPVTIDLPALAKSVTMNDFGPLFVNSPTLINQSTLTVGSGGISLSADSVIENDKSATISVAGLMEVLDQSSLKNYGQITLQGGGDFKDQSAITNFASGTIEVSGGTLNVLVDVANSGLITVDAGATMALDAGTIDGGTVTINGTLELEGGAVLKNGSLGNFGQVNVSGSGNALDHETVTANHALEILAGGSLLIDLGSTIANSGGSVTVDSTATLTLKDATLNGGTLVNDGTVDSTSTSAIDDANITNSGTMESTGGVLTIDPELSVTLTNSGTLQANGGELDITGEPVINTGTLQAINGSILKLTSTTVTNTDGTVSDDSGSTIDLVGSEISGSTLTISGILDSTGTSTIDNANITNTGTMESTGGVLTIDPELSVMLTNSGTLQANGGELDITGEPVINTGTLQAIDDSILKLTSLTVTNTDGTVSDDSGSTLDLIDAIISGGTVSVSGILDSTGTGAIDNASITNTGTMESTGGTFTIDAASSLTNTGTLEADGGTLFIKGDVSGAGAATITDGGTLDFAGADAQTVTFDGAGTLKLEASANFAGTVSGLTTGDAIDLAGTVVTSAYFVGPTLLVNGQPTSFQISSVPAGDTIAFKTDGSGGTDLKVLPQVLAVGSPPPVTGVEGAAIQLDFSDTVTGASLSKFVISGIPDGAIVSDGTAGHSYISGSADGSVDVASWNLSSLTITPANDANFTLSAIVTAVDSNGFDYTLPATEVVTVNPTAPTLTWAAQVSGTETQVALGNLAETITSASGDSNSPNTLTISGAPQGVVLSDGIHTATSDGHTAIDISAWNLSCLTADTSKASVPDGNFSLTATATEKDADGNVSASTMVTEQVTVNPTAPTLTWAAQVSGTETQVALGSLTDTITGHTGDSNSANTLTISGAPQGAVLSDGIHIAISDGHTAIDVSGWNLSCLTANTSGASIPDGNFTLTATATEKDAEHNVSATTTATETVTVTPEAPTVSPVAESGTEGTPIALDLGTKVNGLPGDQNTLASLVVSAIPVGATLKDDQGHTFTATVGSGHQQVDVHGWDLSALTITPVHDTNFALSVAATEKDADGDLSATTTGTEAVTVYDHPTILGETNPATQTIILDESPVVLAAGAITNSLGMPTETFDEVHPGLLSNNGFGHGSFTSFALDATFSSSGDAGVVDGSSSVSAPPFIGPLPGHVDATNYLSIGAGGSETISFATEQNEFGLYWGSVDPSNTIDFYNGTKLVASYTGADISPLLASGGQGSFSSNGYVEFSDLVPFNKVVLSNGNANAFEIDNISAADSHIHLAAPITGTLTVSDDDIGDTLTASVTGDAVVKYNGSTNLPSGINVDALINPTAVTFDSVKADGGADVLHWTYNPTNPDLDFLEPGDTLTVTFNAQVSNGHASAGNQPLTITLVGTGASVVNGTAQNDTFVHVGGGVTIFGNGGNDTFVFSPNFGSATIGDFNVLNDTIDIDHTLFSNVGAILASAQPANFGHDTIITDAAHDKIVLTGVTVTQLNAHDFHLV